MPRTPMDTLLCTLCCHTACFVPEDQRERRLPSSDSEISVLAQNGFKRKAPEQLPCFKADPDGAVSLVALLKVCSDHTDLHRGMFLHADVIKRGLFEINPFVRTTLVNMYAKCGALSDAQRIFNELPALNVVAWNALLSGFTQNGHAEKVLECFDQVQCAGLTPDSVTFVCILKACGSLGASNRGIHLHAQIARKRMLDRNLVIANALVDMYAKCGLLGKAQEVFDELPVRSIVSWTALIAGYAEYGYGEEALCCYDLMMHEGFSANAVTTVCILKACGNIGALEKGQLLHAKIVNEGLLETNTLVANALIDMYIKCDLISKAEEVFDALYIKDVVSWTALIAGLSQSGHGEEALRYFNQMVSEGFIPNAITYTCILKACGSLGALEKGQDIHRGISDDILHGKEKYLIYTAIIDMYAKCGALAMAHNVLDELPTKDIVPWNALIAGYTHYGFAEEVLDLSKQMRLKNVNPDAITYSCILKACSTIGAAFKALEVHASITRTGVLESDSFIGNALLDMYGNCGMQEEAQDAFAKLSIQDVVSWNSLIAGHAYLGEHAIVFELFQRMKTFGDRPNALTFTVLLSSCSHGGLLDNAQLCLESMTASCDTSPTLEHLTCMVDLFSRAGCLDVAVATIKEMPFFADLSLCLTLLGASQQWGSLKLRSWAFEHAAHLNGGAAAYVCMGNVYAAHAQQDDCDNARALAARKRVWTRVLQLAYA